MLSSYMPYDDDYMIYDFKAHRYILTELCVLNELGINLNVRLNLRKSVNAPAAIKQVLNQVSLQVYTYLFRHNDSKTIQWIAACCDSARDILKEAMKNQLLFYLSAGNLSRTSDKSKRDIFIDIAAEAILNSTVEETGVPLTYIGQYTISPPPYGGY